ncbi:MAG: hypothetical protein M3Z27_02905 [Actinomycetota bacterium]|nr:hypothetical protein [Actinomycetota bacterium]
MDPRWDTTPPRAPVVELRALPAPLPPEVTPPPEAAPGTLTPHDWHEGVPFAGVGGPEGVVTVGPVALVGAIVSAGWSPGELGVWLRRGDAVAARTDAPVGPAIAGSPVCLAAARTVATRRVAADLVGDSLLASTIAEGAVPTSSCGQPLKETAALASTNSTATPATSDPAVPKPAMYALGARII